MIIGKNIETLLSALRDSFNRLVYGKQFISYEGITLTAGTVKKLTVPAGVTEAIIQVDSSVRSTTDPQARYTLHGVDPVAGTTGNVSEIGHPLFACAGNYIVIRGYDNLGAFKVISATGVGTQALKVQYYK